METKGPREARRLRACRTAFLTGLCLLVLLVLVASEPSAIARGSSVAAVAGPAGSAVKGDPKDCDDFPNQRRAQHWFRKHNPRRDPGGLDADNDGIACEENPCPCAGKPIAAGERVSDPVRSRRLRRDG